MALEQRMDPIRYTYNGRLWSRCPTTSDSNSFFHSAFGVRTEEGGAYFDKQTEFRRMRWATFLIFFKHDNMPSCLADILRKCLSANDKYKEDSNDDKQNLAKYSSDIMTGEQTLTMEDIPILATLEHIKVIVLLGGAPDPVMVIEPNPNILGNYPKEVPKVKPREVVMCLEENIFARLEPISEGCNPKSDKVETKIDLNKYRKGGSAGSIGMEYQVRLIALVILNALKHELSDWKLSTENQDAGKFDDIVVEWSEGTVLIQCKHKENKKRVTLEELTSTNSKNDDYSLPKYFLSYLQVKEKFNVKNVRICTNAGVNEKVLKYLNPHQANSKDLLHHEEGGCTFYTLNDNFLSHLKERSFQYYQQKNKVIDELVITDENLKDFLKQLQIYFNYPPLNNLKKIIGKLLSETKHRNSQGKITLPEMSSKVMEWFQQKEGVYFTEIRAKAMFAEIWTKRYCQKLEQYKLSSQKSNINLLGPKQIFHVATAGGHLLQVIQIYYAVRNDKSKTLFVNSNHDIDTQKLIVQVFVRVPQYIYLIIIGTRTTEETEEIYGELRHIFEPQYSNKKIILVAEDSKLVQQIQLDDIVQVDGSMAFDDLSLAYQQFLLKKKIVHFQGNRITLKQLLSVKTMKDYGKAVNSTVLEKLVVGEEIIVGKPLLDLDKDTVQCYINRTLKRSLDVKDDEKLDKKETEKVFPEKTESVYLNVKTNTHSMNHKFRTDIDIHLLNNEKKEETVTEESIYNVKEKIILIADSAGTGKTTLLAKLVSIIKESNPYIWVIRVILNDYTPILNDFLSKRKDTITLEELLNSQNTTKLTNHLERYLFASTEKIVLMLDGIDEISPDYTELILSMLEQCKNKESRFAKIFLTTRPHMVKKLKTVLEVEPFILQPLTEQNQLDFLTTYWAHNLKLKDDKSIKKCQRYAKAIINNIFWTNLERNKNKLFTSLPLHLKMSADIFQENSKLIESNTEWRGCKEYITMKEEEPKLTERMNVTRLYELFIEKKRDIFMAKGNPDGKPAAKLALTERFKECLVYHQSLALKLILGEDKSRYFSNHPQEDKNRETDMLSIGVVQKLDGIFEFVHRTFADYFVAKCLLTELQQNPNFNLQSCIIDTVFLHPQYSTIRIFLDDFLLKIIDTLPHTLFENYRANTQQSNWESYKLQSTLIHLLAGDGCITILQFLLKCISFENIADRVLNIKDFYETDFDKDVRDNVFGNTLNVLQYLTRQAGINIRDEEGQTPLHLAAENDHLKMMKYLIEHDAECNIKDNDGFTALHKAAYNGHSDVVKFLIENGSDFNVINKYGSNPLLSATIKGHLEAVKILLEHGADCNIQDSSGFTALHVAARHGRLNMVKLLVENGSDFNVTSKYGSSPLLLASDKGHLGTVKFLLEHGADCNIKNNDGLTALHAAAASGHLDTVRFLVENGLDFNTIKNNGSSPLYSASARGHLETVKFLVEHGADCSITDNNGFTAPHVAAVCGRLDVVKFFIENGLDFNVNIKYGSSPLYSASAQGNLETVKFLVEHGADCNIRDNDGFTSLHAAAATGRLEVVKFFIENGLDFNVISKYGSSPLYSASAQGHLETVKFLVEHGADCNIRDNYGFTALHAAAEYGRLDVVKLLLENGLDSNASSNYGTTPLHTASAKGHLETVKILLEHGADCSIKNEGGCTALHLAALNGQSRTVELLMNYNLI